LVGKPTVFYRLLPVCFVAWLASCGTVLMNQTIERKAKDFTIALTKVKDGPNDYSRGDNSHFVPPDDHRFLWFTVTIRNDSPVAKTFNYDRCDVDDGGDRILPALVDKDAAINILVDGEDELDPQEQITRRMAFPYPEDRLPTRLTCGEAVFELTLKS